MLQSNESTPSTLHRLKSQVFDHVFSTPPCPPQSETSTLSKHYSSAAGLVPSQRAASTPPERTSREPLRQRSHTEDAGSLRVTNPNRNWTRLALSKKKSQYYEHAFAVRRSDNLDQARIVKDFLIIAEVKLNRSVEAEHKFQIDLAFLLSEIYQRPAACIMVLVNFETSILLHTSTEPAYHIAITALASEIASTKNKRTAGLVRDFMLEAANIGANRGAIVFNPMVEENMSTHESSFQQHILEDTETTTICSSPKITGDTKSRKYKKSTTSRSGGYTKTPNEPPRAVTPSLWNDILKDGKKARSTSVENQDKKKVRRRKSFMALFGL